MIIPVRCYTCGAPIARYWEEFRRRVEAGEDPSKVLDDLGVKRLCCRRILLAHVYLIEQVTRFKRIL